MRCPVRDALLGDVQRHLLHLSELAKHEADLVKTEQPNTWLAVDQQIENVLGEKERCLGALQNHRHEHGC